MKFSVFIATSLDGFIARTDGSIDWLEVAGGESTDEEDYGFGEFFASVDCMIMGRNTMDVVVGMGGAWPYAGKRVIVLSNTLKAPPETLVGKIEIYSGSINDLAAGLEKEGYQRAYVDGGQTIQSFINESLITDLTINRIPVVLGEGLSLFGKVPADVRLKHVETKTYPVGFVMSTYEVEVD
jgi:dihydrofolate reductase